ncbi:hypothetical protein QE152_g1536 [Popillia japonica]|uniref:Uncharacterized protein n=1 Tax=Popillia japonica TaxID=7064 RepID=A0AAW1N5U7_POPJA
MEIIEEISQPMLKELHQDALEVPPPQSLSDQDDQPEIIEVLPEEEVKIGQNLPRKACSDTDFDEITQFEPQSPQLVTVQDQETDLIEEIDEEDQETDLIEEIDEEVTNSDQNLPKQACSETDFDQINEVDQINELKPSTLQSSDLDNVQGRESDPIEAIHEELSNSDQNLTKQACSETDFDQINELKPSTLQSSDLDNVQGRESDSIEAIHEEVSNSDQNLPKQASCSETDFDQINELKPSTLQSSDLDNVQGRESDPIEAMHEEVSNSDQNLSKQACSEPILDEITELPPPPAQSSQLLVLYLIEAIQGGDSKIDQNRPEKACSVPNLDEINDLVSVQDQESDLIEAIHEEVPDSDQNLPEKACSGINLNEINELAPPTAQSSQLNEESDIIDAILPHTDQNLPKQTGSDTNFDQINELTPFPQQSSQLVSVQNEESQIQQSSQLVSVQNEESQIIEPIRPKTDQNLPKQSNSDTNLAKISELTPPAPSYYPLVSIQNQELQIIEALQEKVTNSDENVPKHVGSDANFDQINEFPAQSSELVSVQDEESDKIEATQEEVAVSDQNFPEQDRSESNFDEISELGPPPPTPPQLVDVQNQESDSVEDPKQPTPEHVLKTPQNPPKQALEDTNLDEITGAHEIPPPNWTNVQNEESDQNPPILDFSQDPKTHLISPDQIPQIIEETVEAKSPKQSEVPTTTSEGFPNIPNVEAPRFDNFPPPPQISQPDPDDDEHIEIRRSSSALKPTDKDADFERDSIHSGTSFSTEIDDTDPNFGSILNPKSRISRQSSVSSEEEIFRRLSYKLDQHELSFFRDVYKKYEVDRAKSPINDTDMAIIERAKLNSLSPDYDEGLTHFENSPNFLDNDVFIEELRRDCQGGDDAADDDDELTPAELELIRRIKSTKEDRPISDINDLDLRIIDTIRQETLSRKSSRCSDLSSTSVRRRSIHTKHDPVDPRIKLEEDVKIGKTDDQNLEANRGTDDAPVTNKLEEDVKIGKTDDQNLEANRGTDDAPVTKSGADEEKSDEDPARTGAIEREDSKGAEFTHQGVISLEQAKTDDLTADITDSSIRLEESEQEMPEDNKEVELVGTDDGLVRNLVADDEKSRQDQIGMVLIESEDPEIGMVLIESEDPENLENTNQGEVALEQPKNDYLESLLAATITKKNDKPIKPITPPPKPEPPKHIDDGAGQDLFDFLRKPTAKKLHALKSDVPKETGKKNRVSSFTDALLDEDDDQDIQSRYRISSWVKKTTPKRSSVNESIKARQSAFLQAAQIESKPQAPLKVKAKISHTDDFWKKSPLSRLLRLKTGPNWASEQIAKSVQREDYGVTRANSVSSDLSKDPNRSRNLYKSNSVGGRSDPIVMTRSKSVEPIWSAFRTEKDNSSETMSERSISPKGYEPIYANYKELQSPRKPVLMKLKKPPVASPRYERKTSKLKVDNAFDKLNMSKEEDDRSSRESTGSLKSTDRDKGVFMDLPVGTPAIKADDQTASGTKPKQGDKVSKTANLLPSKTSSMDILYDSEESAAISEKSSIDKSYLDLFKKSSIDKSYLDLFKSPEQAVYENLSETERDATKPPFTTIHFYKSGDETERDATKPPFTTIHFYKSGDISSDSSNVSTTNTQVQDDQQLAGQKSSNTNNKVSFLRKKFEQAKSRNRSQNTDDAIEEVSTEIAENHPIEKTQSVPANHALKSVPKASNLPLIIGEVGNQSLASANASLENLRKTSRKSFESARSVFELKVKKQDSASLENLRKTSRKSFESARSVFELKVKKQDSVSEEQIGADVVANSDNLNSESQIEESNANQNNQTVS